MHVRSLLEPLGLCCTFIDDISAYHKFLGEVHCGTNPHQETFERQAGIWDMHALPSLRRASRSTEVTPSEPQICPS
ncbi:hypothetical protein MC885_007774 [Smutsia gigantea]|nr:hypothetical protein MC885_007774 [Smutsia gigantea]